MKANKTMHISVQFTPEQVRIRKVDNSRGISFYPDSIELEVGLDTISFKNRE